MNNQVVVIACKCEHAYQDRRYGPGNRVHNLALAANNKAGGYRCTVCSSAKPITSGKTTPLPKKGGL